MRTRYDSPNQRHENEGGSLNDHRRLKIVHAVRSDRFAGVERYIATVSVALAHRGHSVVVIGGDPSRMTDAIAGSEVEYRPAVRTHHVARELTRVARDSNVIHVHMTAAEIGATLASATVRAPIVATRHFAAVRGSSVGARLASRIVRRRLRVQISISKFVAQSVGETTTTILNGVPDAPAVDPTSRVVLVAQRLQAEKHTRDALDAWAASHLHADGWVLRIAGRGAEQRALKEHAKDRGLHGVDFLGYRDDIAEVRQSAGIFLATAPQEPFGLSVAEAMAAGLPVVAAGSGGHLETVGAARPDLLYRSGDPLSAARALRLLTDDVEARRSAGRDLRAFQQRELGLERHIDALTNVYLGLQISRRQASSQ